MSPVLELRGAGVEYGHGRRRAGGVVALRNADLAVDHGERVALVGRSGAGKSTLARVAVGLVPPTTGTVTVLGQDITALSARRVRRLRRRMQIVFQDPYQSLHPGLRVGHIVAEPLRIAGIPRHARRPMVTDALEMLGLRPAERFIDRYPASLSGGQRQRVAMARTLVAGPELILADEPASMLDASLRASIAEQLLAVKTTLDATLIFVTHDFALARHVADRIVVLADGLIVEDGPTEQVIAEPAHRETRLLLAAAGAVYSPRTRSPIR